MYRVATVLLLILGLWLGAATGARAAITVHVVSTDPPGDVITLSRNQNFYMRLHYQTDQSVHI